MAPKSKVPLKAGSSPGRPAPGKRAPSSAGYFGAASRAAVAAGFAKLAPEKMAGVTRECVDVSAACGTWAYRGDCEKNKKFMARQCPVTCKVCTPDASAGKSKTACVDDEKDCEGWALRGECYKNVEFMRSKCRKSCGVCGPFGPACERVGEAAVQPGTMNKMFQRAVDEFPELGPRVLLDDPYVLQFDSFLTDEEADGIVSLCTDEFQRSLAGDYVSPVRTSTQCWCNFQKCLKDPVMKRVEAKISRVTGVPVEYGEFMQIVKYEEGQFYKLHHDQNSATWSPQGVRVYTFFMYLNDVDEGGETDFPQLKLTVKPRKGSAILWPSVLNDAPNATDHRTNHAALPVVKGTKLGANMWIHMHDFRTASFKHCLFTMKNTVE